MNRRKAIVKISLAGAGVVAAASGYKWYEISKKPDLHFVEQNRELIAALAETIIPATDLPGAKDTGTDEFIIKMVKYCTDRKSQNNFVEGLKELKGHCMGRFGKTYQECSASQQEQVMNRFRKNGKPYRGIIGKAQTRFLGKSFFTLLKEYTVAGYCTSKAGATQGLAHVYVPGRFEGCISMQPGQKAWATN